MRINALVCAVALSVFASGGAFAFDAAAPDSTGGPVAKPNAAPDPEDAGARTAKNLECSQKADAQNLHRASISCTSASTARERFARVEGPAE